MNMLLKCYKKIVLTVLAMVFAMTIVTASNASLFNYRQNFESLNRADAAVLGNDGWLVYANIYDTSKTSLISSCCANPAPNGGAGFSSITAGKGSAAQGAQQLTVFSDYNNPEHATGRWIETLLYQEQMITSADVGSTLSFIFDARQGYISGDSTAGAFIRTVDPDANFSITNNVFLDTTRVADGWSSYMLDFMVPDDNSLDGQLLQFGFSTFAANYQGSDNFYDNINVSVSSVPLPAGIWLFLSGFTALIGWARIKR